MRKLVFICLLGLGACSTPLKADKSFCQPVTVWSKSDQAGLSKELDTAGPLTQRAVLELFTMRQEARACAKQMKSSRAWHLSDLIP